MEDEGVLAVGNLNHLFSYCFCINYHVLAFTKTTPSQALIAFVLIEL